MSGPECCENPPILSSGSGEGGHVEDIGGLSSYVSGSVDSKLAIVLISDVFGYDAPKLRKLADKVSAAGFYVVVPDFFYGDPYVPEGPKPVLSWLEEHSTDKGCEDARKVVAALKSRGISAIGAAGFCWGGVVVVKLAKYDDIQAGVTLHPGPLTVDEINEVKVPIAILGAGIDKSSPPEQMEQFGEILSKKVDCFVKIYPDVTHGWTVRYKDEDEFVVNSAMEAHTDMLNWFTKHIK